MRQLTPRGVSGVAVFAFSVDERQLLRSCLRAPGGLPFQQGASVAPTRARLVVDEVPIDDVLLIDRGAAGDELHTHGSPGVLDLVRRRFRAEDHTFVPTPAMALAQRAMCFEQLSLAEEQTRWDFPEELRRIDRMDPGARHGSLLDLIRRSRAAIAQTRPCPVVFVGRQNVGKSTLFNKLLGKQRAVVGPQAGLTRDSVRETAVLDGLVYELIDAAGEGVEPRDVDAAAIAMARKWRRDAAWIVVLDAGRESDEREREWARRAAVVVRNKVDLGCVAWATELPGVAVSARDDDGAVLCSTIGAQLRRSRGLGAAGPVGGVAAIDEHQVALLREFAARHGLESDCDGLDGPA